MTTTQHQPHIGHEAPDVTGELREAIQRAEAATAYRAFAAQLRARSERQYRAAMSRLVEALRRAETGHD